MTQEITAIGTQVIRQLDSFTIESQTGDAYVQRHCLYAIGADGTLTDEPMVFSSDPGKAGYVWDSSTGYLYYETTERSRFLKYGYDSGTGNAVAYDFTGASEMEEIFSRGEIYAYDVTLNGVSYKGLSMLQLLMLITIARAEAIETALINEMDKLAEANMKSSVSTKILEGMQEASASGEYYDHDTIIEYGAQTMTVYEYLTDVLGLTVTKVDWTGAELLAVMDSIMDKQDSFNNLSQELMINNQSLVNKRDQAYLLGTNSVKLLQNGNLTIVRNV